jgi:hypothetical protein
MLAILVAVMTLAIARDTQRLRPDRADGPADNPKRPKPCLGHWPYFSAGSLANEFSDGEIRLNCAKRTAHSAE